MKKCFFFISLMFLFSSVIYSQSKDERSIRDVLHRQQNAWNAGQLDKFMIGYWQSDSLMFIGKSGVTYGWQKTLENYKKNYPDKSAMGKLQFTMLHFKPLTDSYYFVVGKWFLERNIGSLEGHFTLLFRKIQNEWVIVADHSS